MPFVYGKYLLHTWEWIETLGEDVYEQPYSAGEESAMTRDVHEKLEKGR